MEDNKQRFLADRIKERFSHAILETIVSKGEVTHVVKKDHLLDVLRFVKSDKELCMNYLSDILGVDLYPAKPRFEVVYNVLSINKKWRLRLKVRITDGETMPSVTSVWRGANWAERETFDMFGIVFEGHPNLKRIFMPDDWDGFPLRKDYPLRGYKDQYNPFGEEKK